MFLHHPSNESDINTPFSFFFTLAFFQVGRTTIAPIFHASLLYPLFYWVLILFHHPPHPPPTSVVGANLRSLLFTCCLSFPPDLGSAVDLWSSISYNMENRFNMLPDPEVTRSGELRPLHVPPPTSEHRRHIANRDALGFARWKKR